MDQQTQSVPKSQWLFGGFSVSFGNAITMFVATTAIVIMTVVAGVGGYKPWTWLALWFLFAVPISVLSFTFIRRQVVRVDEHGVRRVFQREPIAHHTIERFECGDLPKCPIYALGIDGSSTTVWEVQPLGKGYTIGVVRAQKKVFDKLTAAHEAFATASSAQLLR